MQEIFGWEHRLFVASQECDFPGVGTGISEVFFPFWTKGCFIKLSAFQNSMI